MTHQLGGKVVAVRQSRVRPRLHRDRRRRRALFDGLWNAGETPPGVDEPRRPGRARCPRASSVVAASEGAPLRDRHRRGAALLQRCMFHPEVVHTPDGGKLLANFVAPRLRAAPATGRWPSSAPPRSPRSARRSATGRVICGLSGGVDSAVAAVLIHEAIGDQLTCVFVDHGLMRAGRGRAGRQPVPQPLQHPAGPCGRARRCSSAASPGVTDPEAKRKFIGKTFIDVFEAEAKQDRRRRFPRAGHALSRRDRKRQLHRRPVGDDQEPPQCRRPARADEHEAGRAAARTVQGRGARARPRARPARRLRRPPSVPRPRPRDPHPGRGHARSAATSCARPTRSISRRSATPGSTTRSGRRSRCCCRCAPSA